MQDINSQEKQIVCFNHRVAALVADTGVAEQVNIWGGGDEHAKHAPLGGSGGMLPQENFRICTL